MLFPDVIPNWVRGAQVAAVDGRTFEKRSPHDGSIVSRVARSGPPDVAAAVAAARAAQPAWADAPAVERGTLLHMVCNRLEDATDTVARIVARETGKSLKDARGET